MCKSFTGWSMAPTPSRNRVTPTSSSRSLGFTRRSRGIAWGSAMDVVGPICMRLLPPGVMPGDWPSQDLISEARDWARGFPAMYDDILREIQEFESWLDQKSNFLDVLPVIRDNSARDVNRLALVG